MTDPWLSRQMAHDAAWVRLDQHLALVTEAALAETLAKLWRVVLDERPAITAAVDPPSLDGLEQVARETWTQALTRWVRPVAFAAYAAQYGSEAPTAGRDRWWADTLARVAETADRLVQAVRAAVAGAPTASVDELRDRVARVLGLDAATRTITERIESVEARLANDALTVGQRADLLSRRVRLQAELFRVQASQARSKAYLALAQAMPAEAGQFRELARMSARGAGGGGALRRELAQVDAQLYRGTGLSAEEESRLRFERAALYAEAEESGETWRNTARRIARTESTNVLNEATLQRGLDAETASGDELVKTWLSSRDERVRETHRIAHGQVQPLSQPFQVGAALLQRPGDPNGPPAETVQCRCTIAVLTRDEHEEIAAVLAAATLEEPMSETAVEAAARPSDELPIGWRGVIMAMDTDTGDRRSYLSPVTGVLPIREAPRSLLWQPALASGHDGGVVVGNIAKAWIDGNLVWGQGAFDLESENGREAARLLHRGFLNGVSADLDQIEFEYDPDADFLTVTQWRIMTATMVAQPAFTEARIQPVYASDLDLTLVASLTAAAAEAREAPGVEAGMLVLERADFEPPEFTGPTPLTVTAEGRVFGHLAQWGVCHVGIGNACVVAPHTNTGYAYFHTGSVLLRDGSELAVGKITLGGGHADPNLGFVAAAEHYDNVESIAAYVRATEDEHGIAVAGRITPGLSEDRLMKLRAAPLSGDWRRVGGNLELVAALGVVVPGFPVPRTVAASAHGQQLSLVAAGVVKPRSLEESVAAEVRAALRREERARHLAARAGLDLKSRAAAAAARISIKQEA